MAHIRRESEEQFEAARLIAEAYADASPTATAYRDITPAQQTGTQPVAQPGRPPMSQKATDHASLVLAYSFGSVPVGGIFSLVLWSLSNVPPETLAIAGAAPPVLVLTAGLAARLIGRAVREGAEALPPGDQHHHYDGPTYVQHTSLHTNTRGLGRTVNQLPKDSQ